MKASGLSNQVKMMPDAVNAGFQQAQANGSAIPAKQSEELRKALVKAFSPKDLSKTIHGEIKKSLTQKDAKSLMKWYNSKLGKKVAKAEEKASTPQAMNEMMAQAQTLVKDEARVQMAVEITNLVKAVDMAMDLQKQTSKTIFAAMMGAAGQKADMKAFDQQMAANEAQIRTNIQQMVVISMLYAYKDLSNNEIKKYIAFLKQPSSNKFNTAALKGLSTGLTRSVDSMAKSMAAIFKKHNKS